MWLLHAAFVVIAAALIIAGTAWFCRELSQIGQRHD